MNLKDILTPNLKAKQSFGSSIEKRTFYI